MRAAVFEEFGRPLVVTTVPDPAPAPGELVLRVRSCGICGTDLHLSASAHGVPRGTVMGHEFAGEIVAVGAGVTDWRLGERVCAMPYIGCGHCVACRTGDGLACPELRSIGLGGIGGAYAEFVKVGTHETLRLPEGCDCEMGALVEPLAVGLRAVRAARIEAGDRVLVLGAGPIGLATTTWARSCGATAVVVADKVASRLALAPRLGATAVANVSGDTPDSLYDVCQGPPDVVFECVGMPGMLHECVQCVRRRGRVIVVGACMEPDMIFPAMACFKEVELRFVVAYSRHDFALTAQMLAAGRIGGPEMITGRVGLDDFPQRFDALRTAPTECKVLLQP